LSGNVWAQVPIEGKPDPDDRFVETDYTIAYEITFEPVTLGGGLLWYTYSKDEVDIPNTREFYVSVSVDTMLTPTFKYYRDYDAFKNNYYELSFSQKIEDESLGAGFNLTPSLVFVFASQSKDVFGDNGLTYVMPGLSSDFKLGEITVTPAVYYNFKVADFTKDEFWMGITLSYSL
jgi:hypothetical protein